MTTTELAHKYDQGELSAEEAVSIQQQFCQHINYAEDQDGDATCLDCGAVVTKELDNAS